MKSWFDVFSLIIKYMLLEPLTETKKLEVPSAREKRPGNNFNQVSSPYITNFPACFDFNCTNQLSWWAKLELVSDSAKFRMRSRKDGIDPVVIAFIRGIVIVGELACAVKGNAAPDLTKLWAK